MDISLKFKVLDEVFCFLIKSSDVRYYSSDGVHFLRDVIVYQNSKEIKFYDGAHDAGCVINGVWRLRLTVYPDYMFSLM